MAYDWYVAICHPLHYMVIMKPRLCGLLVLSSYIMRFSCIPCTEEYISFLVFLATELNGGAAVLLYKQWNPSLFLWNQSVVLLALSDTSICDVVMYFAGVLIGGVSFTCILYSYSQTVSSVCGISSAQGKYKAFSTCASHLSVVSLFYCSVLGVYIVSANTHGSQSSAVTSVMYTVVTHAEPFHLQSQE